MYMNKYIKEEWKQVNGYGDYYISNHGRVLSKKRGDKYLKPSKTNYGHEMVTLCNNTKDRFLVHRLVAEHFLLNPNKYEVVHHKDGYRNNNVVSNLEWTTFSENNRSYNHTDREQKILAKEKPKLEIESLKNEEWIEIKEMDGYMVSNYGRYYSSYFNKLLKVDYNKGIKPQFRIKKGDKCVRLYVDEVINKYFNKSYFQFDANDIENIPGEKWHLFENNGVDPIYYISNIGRYKKKYKFGYKLAILRKGLKDYIYFPFTQKDGKQNSKPFHRYVAKYFVKNQNEKVNNIVNHIDGDITNNKASNLEWCTQAHNVRHAVEIGLTKHGKLSVEKVKKIRKMFGKMETKELAAIFNVACSTINQVQNNKTWNDIK
jgi:hypothetical protein